MEVSEGKADKPSVSVIGVSQEEGELFCDPCSTDGHQLSIAGFCVDCQHYLCETCYKYHCRALPMRKHVLLDRNTMPQQKNQTLIKDKCTQHEDKSIKYFCQSHNQLGCSVCMTIEHRGCDRVNYIPDICKEIEDSAEYKDFIMKINKTKEKFDDTKNNAENNISKSKTHYNKVIKDIERLRKEINTIFDELEGKIEEEAKHNQDADIQEMGTISATCDRAIQDIQTLKSDLEMLKKSKQYEKLFIKMKKSQTDVNVLKDSVAKMAEWNKISDNNFVPDEQINNLLRNLKVLGQLRNHKDLQAKHFQDIKVSSSRECFITGSTIMSDGQLAIIDNNMSTVMLVNTQQNKVTSQLKLSSQPWDITETNPRELAVTLREKHVIQFVHVSVSDTLSKGCEVKVNGECQGIVCYMDKLAVTFSDPLKVEIMEMDGTVLKVISTDSIGGRLFIDPYYIAVSPDHTTLYVSDLNNHALTSLTLEGEVMATYKDNDLKNATGVCVDHDGTIYVCGYHSHNVHQITADNEKLQILLNQSDQVQWPYSISYSDKENKLYIGMYGNNILKVYCLE